MSREKRMPELRFKEFNDFYDFDNFGSIFKILSTNSFSRSKMNDEYGEVMNLHYGDVHSKFPTILDIKENNIPYINKDIDISKITKECYCRNGDIVIADTSEDYDDVGKTIEIKNITNEKILSGLHTFLCRDRYNVFIDEYKGFLMNSPSVHKQVRVLATGIKVYGINKSNLVNILLPIPSKEEQYKVADTLSTVDKKILNKQKQIEALENIKKGYLEKIFSQEIRFKGNDESEFEKWQEVKLKNVFTKIRKKNTDNMISNVISNSAEMGLIRQRDYFKKDIANKLNTNNYYIINYGDFVYNPRKSSNAPYGPINMYKDNKEGIVSPLYLCFRSIEDIVHEFFLYYFKSSCWYRYIYMNSDVGARHDRVSIKESIFFDMKIKIPSIQEQQKIADFLLTFDKKIKVEKEILKHWKQVKRGLLQKMFV